MTREETISLLKQYIDYDNADIPDFYTMAEACEVAIKALKQQDKVLDAIKEIRDLLKQPAAYVPNYDAYGLCLSIICKHLEVEG